MTRPLLLDLFCGAGGAAMGYYRAGFDVVGVDIKPQPHYPFEFQQDDALRFLEDRQEVGFDAIHASPPCQAYSSATKAWGRTQEHPDLLADTRRLLVKAGLPWVIENVDGAPIDSGIRLCGSMFGLWVQRHRWFETRDLVMSPLLCKHTGRALTVTGHTPYWWDKGARTVATQDEVQRAMGIEWMNGREIVQAIPPAYTEFIGQQLIEQLERVA